MRHFSMDSVVLRKIDNQPESDPAPESPERKPRPSTRSSPGIVDRQNEQARAKAARIRSAREAQRAEEDCIISQAKRPRRNQPTTPKKPVGVWDEDGNLIDRGTSIVEAPSTADNTMMNRIGFSSIAQGVERRSIFDRALDRSPAESRRERGPTISVKKFNEFIKRQTPAPRKQKIRRHKSMMNANSAMIQRAAEKRAKKTEEENTSPPEVECETDQKTLTKSAKVRDGPGIAERYSLLISAFHETDVEGLRVLLEAERTQECTFTPDLTSSYIMRENAGKHQAEILQRNMDRAQLVASEVAENEERIKKWSGARKVPKVTKNISGFMEGLNSNPRPPKPLIQ